MEQAVEKLQEPHRSLRVRGALDDSPPCLQTSLSRAAPLPNQLESVTSASPAIPQARRDAVDGELDAGQHLLARRARTVQLQKLDLYVVEWVEIRETIADRAVEQRIAFEQLRLLHDC